MSQANRRYVVKASPDHILMCDWSFVAPGQATHPWCPCCCESPKTLSLVSGCTHTHPSGEGYKSCPKDRERERERKRERGRELMRMNIDMQPLTKVQTVEAASWDFCPPVHDC